MRAAHLVVGVVSVAADALLLAVGVLERDLDVDVLQGLFHVQRLVQRIFGAVQIFDELGDAAFVAERFFLVGPFIHELDGQALVEKGQLAQAHFERIVIEADVVENLGIGMELHCACRSSWQRRCP